MRRTNEIYHWTSEGLIRKDKKEACISNFCPNVIDLQDTQEGRQVIIELIFISGTKSRVTVSVDNISRIDWFKLDNHCIVNDDVSNAQKYLSQFIRMQIAEYMDGIDQITQYSQIGWNFNAYGNAVYVFGNAIIGGTDNDRISSALEGYKLEYCHERQEEMLKTFVELLCYAPSESRILLLYFFTGIIKSLYREANVPVDFSLYIFGEQQNRKTTLAKLTNSLYNRNTDMDFSLRTIAMITESMADKLLSAFKDTTLILDDLSMTNDKQYQQKQERVMEHVVRMLGNRARKSSNIGNSIKEYFPYANVIFTGEYLPNFPESTLSRMLIMEIENPVDSSWLIAFGKEPQMLSTVAYSFILWIQKEYSKYVNIIQRNFERYRENKKESPVYQERISEHGFIMTCTGSLINDFLIQKGYVSEASYISSQNSIAIQELLQKQIELMEDCKLKNKGKDFCCMFAKLYMGKHIKIAKVGTDRKKLSNYDGFMHDKHTICISTISICDIMRFYYKDNSITIQAITKQLKDNHFLIMDNSKQPKSTKKVDNARYLHILKDAVKEYYEYYCH